MQNVTGGTSPLPAIRPPAPEAAAAALPASDPSPEILADLVPTVEQPRDGGYGTGAATTGARPSALSLPGMSRPSRTAEGGEGAEGAGSFATMELQVGPHVDGTEFIEEMGSTSKGTSKGSSGSRGTRST